MSGGITRDLHLATHAMRGEDVKALQKALNGHLAHHAKDGAPKTLAVDGGYGPATAHAFRWVAYYVLGFPQGTIDKGATRAAQRLVRDTGGLDKTKRARAAARLKALRATHTLEGGKGLAFPLGRKPSAVYGPGQGTHSWTAPPNNWESDNACDLMVPSGTPCYAVDDGVIGSQFGPLESGNPRFAGIRLHLQVARGSGIEWYMAHLRDTAPGIRPGARVKKGQLLGHSGVANGVAHLHIACELGYDRRDGKAVRTLLGV